MIAIDILAISIYVVASKSAFSMGGQVVSPYRSRLHAKTMEAFMYLQNWMIGGMKVMCISLLNIFNLHNLSLKF